jgi:integral membrane protein
MSWRAATTQSRNSRDNHHMSFLQAPGRRDNVAYSFYRTMAYITGAALAVMSVGALLKYGLGVHVGSWYAAGWILHGYAYVVYLAAVVRITIRERWPLQQMFAVGLAGTIPAVGIIVERRLRAVRA